MCLKCMEFLPSYADLLELDEDGLVLVERRARELAEQTRIIRKDRNMGVTKK